MAEPATDHFTQPPCGEGQTAVQQSYRRTLVAFRFEKASCVVVGTFNMYILHPQWLAKHKIIEEGTEVGIETNLTQPGFRFRFPKNKAIWSVAPHRLAIESQDPKTDCGETVAKILRVLPETPLFALGNNVHYQAKLSELENLSEAIREFPRTESPTPEQAVAQRTFRMGVKRGEHETVNVQISLEDDCVKLACNVHAELGNREDADDAAVDAAKRFFDDRAEVKDLAQHFFGTSIDHD